MGLNSIVGGVHGKPRTNHGDADNFSVVGTTGGYSSTGVLGIGGEKGHGVVGLPGMHESFTTAGVRGFTREGGWPPPHFPLTESAFSKEQVGVLGQAVEYMGVWGESIEKVGVVGTAGQRVGFMEVSDTAGVYGHSDIGYGVVGEARLPDPKKAGVKAVGDGTSGPGVPNAAALEIDNGAITVSGVDRPAGIHTFSPSWTPQTDEPVIVSCSCGCGHDPHQHIYYYWTISAIFNPLIVPNSIIQLTVQASEPMFAQVVNIGNGVAQIQVTTVTPPFPPEGDVIVHYLIINPN
jgi:hypothetical protein